MKKGARVINCARGGIINEEALAEALQVGPPRRRGARRLRAGAAAGRPSAAEAAQRRRHAAPRRLDGRGPGIGRPRGGPAADRLPARAASCSSPSTWPPSIAPSWRSCGCTSTWPAGSACCTPRCARGRSSKAELTYRGEVARRSTKLITAAFAAGLLEYAARPERQHRQRRAAGPRARHRDRRADQSPRRATSAR